VNSRERIKRIIAGEKADRCGFWLGKPHAETLAKHFKGKITFLGGIDTQYLLVNATPEEVKADVRRVKRLLGLNLIVSPSHEAILPNVPQENILAMAEAAIEEWAE